MMNIPPSEAAALSLYDYEALLWHWNDAHDTEGPTTDADRTLALVDAINLDPRLTGPAPAKELTN